MGTQAIREKFINLRKRLDQLGYKQPLSLDCLPLVERLFCDLVWTTESLRNAKSELLSQFKLRSNIEDYVSAYKADNGRLIRDNNDLHRHLLALRQDIEEKTRAFDAKYRRSEGENKDLKLFNSQCMEKIKEYEVTTKRMTEQLTLLQEKNSQVVMHTPGGRRKQLPFRRQKVNIDTLVPEKISDNSAYCCSIARLWHITNPTDPQEINLLDLATKRCEDLEKQLERLEEELTLNEKKIENFRHQISLRDAEIDRLRTITEGGRPLEAVIQDSTERQADREIQRLQIQVDLLQARNAELESHFINTINKEPIEHCPPSQKISLAMCSVEVQTFSSVLPGQTDVSCQAVFPDHPCLSHIMYNMKHIQQLLNGIDNGRKLFIKRLDALATRGTKPITELTAKTAVSRTPRLHDREKHLEALKEAYGKHIQSLKNDCQYWRFEAHTVITALRQITEAFCNPQLITGLFETQPPPHPSHINGYLRDVARQATPCVPQRRTLTPPPHRIQSSAKCERRSASLDLSTETEINLMRSRHIVHSLSSELQSTQLERDHYRQLLDTARHSMRNSLQGRLKHLSLIQRNLGDSGDVSTEVSRLRQERDKLHSLMGKFERQLSDIQSNVRVLTLERNQLYEQLEQSRKELSSARDQLARLEDSRNQALRVTHCSLTPNTTSDHSQCVHSSPSSTRSMLLRLERDRDQLVDELRHMTSERDSLRDRLHDLTEKSLSEKARLLQRLDDAEKELNSHKQTPEDDALHSAEMTHRVNALEAERRELLDRIDCLEQSKANDHRLKTVERNLQTIQTRLNEVQMECESLREEAVRLRRTIRQMDGEKDTLQAALDERTERCAALEREFAKVELQLHEYQKSSQTFEQRALRLSKSVVQKDAEFRELSERAAFLEVELKQAKEALGHANLETQQVKNDLGAAVNESQHLCTQLRMESEKLSDLQSRLDASNAELAVSKEMSSHTEQERINLLKQYRALTLELNDKADCVERLESQMRDVQHTCSVREQEAASLRRQVDAMRKEIADYQEVVGTLESQCALFSRAASESEERVRRLQAENEDVHREISDVRTLCDHLEHQSRIHQQFVTTSNLETGQLKTQLAEAEREVCSLRKQVDHEIGTIRNLETILASTREEELKAQRNLQNYRMELQFTREKLEQRTRSLTETELEVHNLRSQLASLKMKMKLNWPRTGANRASRSYGDSFEPFMESKFSNTSCNPVILEENGVTGGEHLEEAPRPTDTGVSNSAALQDASSVDSLLTDSNTNGLDADLTEPNLLTSQADTSYPQPLNLPSTSGPTSSEDNTLRGLHVRCTHGCLHSRRCFKTPIGCAEPTELAPLNSKSNRCRHACIHSNACGYQNLNYVPSSYPAHSSPLPPHTTSIETPPSIHSVSVSSSPAITIRGCGHRSLMLDTTVSRHQSSVCCCSSESTASEVELRYKSDKSNGVAIDRLCALPSGDSTTGEA